MVKAWELGFAPPKVSSLKLPRCYQLLWVNSCGAFFPASSGGCASGRWVYDPRACKLAPTLYTKNNSLDKNDVKSHADDVVQLYINPIAKERKEALWEIGID